MEILFFAADELLIPERLLSVDRDQWYFKFGHFHGLSIILNHKSIPNFKWQINKHGD